MQPCTPLRKAPTATAPVPPTLPIPHAGPSGLLYDRCWALVDASGAALRLKRCPALARICAKVDLQRGLLVVTAEGERPLELPLPEEGEAEEAQAGSSSGSSGRAAGALPGSASSSGIPGPVLPGSSEPFSVRVCSRTAWVRRSADVDGGDAAAAAWFSRVLGMPCRLVQQAPQAGGAGGTAAGPAAGAAGSDPVDAATSSSRGSHSSSGSSSSSGGGRSSISTGSSQRGSFANEGHLLVLSAASLADLAARAGSSEPPHVFAQRFRWARSAGAQPRGTAWHGRRAGVGSRPGRCAWPLLPLTSLPALPPSRPNLIVEGCEPYSEDGWRRLRLLAAPGPPSGPGSNSGGSSGGSGSSGIRTVAAPAHASSAAVQLVSAGPCARCDVVCVEPLTGG